MVNLVTVPGHTTSKENRWSTTCKLYLVNLIIINLLVLDGEWFNGKTAAFKVADLGSNPSSPAVDVVGISGLVVTLGLFYERAHQCLSRG